MGVIDGGVGVTRPWVWWIPECFVVWVVAGLWGWSGDGGVVVGLPLSSLSGFLNSHRLSFFLSFSFFF